MKVIKAETITRPGVNAFPSEAAPAQENVVYYALAVNCICNRLSYHYIIIWSFGDTAKLQLVALT